MERRQRQGRKGNGQRGCEYVSTESSPKALMSEGEKNNDD
jgi:hypothetical protein